MSPDEAIKRYRQAKLQIDHVYITNIMKHIPVEGSFLGHQPEMKPEDEEIMMLRKQCEPLIKRMYHCRQCRSDALGTLDNDLSISFKHCCAGAMDRRLAITPGKEIPMNIAVLVDSTGKTSGFEKDGIVKVYTKIEDSWTIQRYRKHNTQTLNNAEELRQSLHETAVWLKDCKIIVVNRIRGIQYIAFEEFQISMLQIAGFPKEFLNDIQDCAHHKRLEQKISLEHIAIFEQRPGCFYTDLRDVMSGKTSYNSKQILLPFLKENEFESLEMVCEHVPKWFEKELPGLNLAFRSDAFKNCVKVQIYPVTNA